MKELIEAIYIACNAGYITEKEAKRRVEQILKKQLGK